MSVNFHTPGLTKKIVLGFTLILFCLGLGFFLNNDFWQDEIYTIEHFIFVSWNTLLTDYHSTNNHIAFNAVVKFFAILFGTNAIGDALEKPYFLRVFPFLFTILSVVFFYRRSAKHYGKLFAKIGVSILCTSIVLIDFGVQLRGYSFSIFLSIVQYFTFLEIIKYGKRNLLLLKLFLLTGLSLLCLPTNIYLVFTYLLFCAILFLKPSISFLFLNKKFSRNSTSIIAATIAIPTVFVLLYYKWLLQLQPENLLITSFQQFKFENLIQALAIFFHFTDYRYYFFIFLVAWVVLFYKKFKSNFYSDLVLPAFFFFVPFLFFFIHGSIIIQRVFLCLLPFFVMIVTAAVVEMSEAIKIKNLVNYLLLANIFCLMISFSILFTSSKQNNRLSIHKHDLRNHYYLVNFNARKATLLAKKLSGQEKLGLYVWDGYGQTGIGYYLNRFKVPFEKYYDSVEYNKSTIILTNEKRELENILNRKRVVFQRLLNKEEQYNIYLLHTN
ncbi:MAG: hypothetical protein M3352_02845 [Bacteroidota bacterium]|nr:hypothetical protein [Bacteroidota bacterium]